MRARDGALRVAPVFPCRRALGARGAFPLLEEDDVANEEDAEPVQAPCPACDFSVLMGKPRGCSTAKGRMFITS